MAPPTITASQPVDPSAATHTEGGGIKPNTPSVDFGPLPGMSYVASSESQPVDPSAVTHTEGGGIKLSTPSVNFGPLPGMPYVASSDSPSASPEPIAIATAGSRPVYVLSQGEVSVAGLVVSEGGPAMTIDTIRVSADAHAIYIGSSVVARPTPIPELKSAPSVIGGQTMEAVDSPTAKAPSVIAGQGIGAGPNGAVVSGSLTISEGQQRTVDGTYVSVGSSYLAVSSSIYDKP